VNFGFKRVIYFIRYFINSKEIGQHLTMLYIWSSVMEKQEPSFPGVQLARLEISMPAEVSPTPFPMAANTWAVLGVVLTKTQKAICVLEYDSAANTSDFGILNTFSKEEYVDYDNDVVWSWRKEQMEAWMDTNVNFCFRLVYADNPLIDS
jgi:hypothetical protein